jgi:phage shock protein PspC (stress-responsive transcriptional regulator)
MKKTISINISGLIFYIEEEGYDKLHIYLETIKRYFASYADSAEIVADIENRIAEKFTSKQNHGKQVITEEDVDAVIATMGSISDFQEIEEPVFESAYTNTSAGHGAGAAGTTTAPPPVVEAEPATARKLYRDTKRKLLGGVASGIAHYYTIDPLWVRLALVVLVFTTGSTGWHWFTAKTFIFNQSISSLVVIGYIIMWVIVPGSSNLSENKVKKLYRNPKDKVVGGVSSGLASYFGVDVIAVRLVFILALLIGGSGFLIYIVLWIITPEAKTLTEKMEMQGEPVTLANIEANIKNSFKSEPGKESDAVRVLMFPFRAISLVFTKGAEFIKPLFTFFIEAFRIMAGLFLLFISAVCTLASIVAFGALIGVITNDHVVLDNVPFHLFRDDIPGYAPLLGLICALIPSIFIGLSGLSVLAKRSLYPAWLGWSAFAIWLLAALGLSAVVTQYATYFNTNGQVSKYTTYAAESQVVFLETTGRDRFALSLEPKLMIQGYAGDSIELQQINSARGRNYANAEQNAAGIIYRVRNVDSTLVFGRNYTIPEGNSFRNQQVELVLRMPYGQVFEMSPGVGNMLHNTLNPAGYRREDIPGNQWRFTRSGLECITCDGRETTPNRRRERRNMSDATSEYTSDTNYTTGAGTQANARTYNLGKFNKIYLQGAYKVIVKQGSDFQVEATGPRDLTDNLTINVRNNELQAKIKDFRARRFLNSDYHDIVLHITAPDLSAIRLGGAIAATVDGFNNDHLAIKMSGASSARVNSSPRTVKADLSGACELTLHGEATKLTAEASGASEINAHNFISKEAIVKTTGSSDVRVHVTENLEANASGVSSIAYTGTPTHVNEKKGTLSSIARK